MFIMFSAGSLIDTWKNNAITMLNVEISAVDARRRERQELARVGPN